MPEPLYLHIKRHTALSEAEFNAIGGYFDTRKVKKKELLVTEGKLCTRHFFVVKGCLRLFFLKEDGQEQTIQFAIENWWMTDIDAFNKKKRAAFSVQAIEATEVLEIEKSRLDELLEAHPLMERYFRMVYERAYTASLFRVKYIFQLSKDAFYEHFSNTYPEFVQRIPQKVLASFLGFTPEYLSALRKKKTLKGKKG